MARDHIELLLALYPEAYRLAFETAVRTGTPLIQMSKEGKMERYYPPYRYVMVPKDPNESSASPHEKLHD